jgi:hypothetical protein
MKFVRYVDGFTIDCTYPKHLFQVRVRVIVFNATVNTIAVISWRSVILVEEKAEYSRESYRPVVSH